ncbi:MAG: hypothetical protein JNK79_08780 [Chitinophagaceae bacterium]|nr:hypothetical protein [Chitinophagaceae bacterium]
MPRWLKKAYQRLLDLTALNLTELKTLYAAFVVMFAAGHANVQLKSGQLLAGVACQIRALISILPYMLTLNLPGYCR